MPPSLVSGNHQNDISATILLMEIERAAAEQTGVAAEKARTLCHQGDGSEPASTSGMARRANR